MAKYRKKPVIIEAVRVPLLADDTEGWMNLDDFLCGYFDADHLPIKIKTLEGTMEANAGDWIIKGIQGEFYPCKPDTFEQTYEAV